MKISIKNVYTFFFVIITLQQRTWFVLHIIILMCTEFHSYHLYMYILRIPPRDTLRSAKCQMESIKCIKMTTKKEQWNEDQFCFVCVLACIELWRSGT